MANPPPPPEPPDLCCGRISVVRSYCTSPYHAYYILRWKHILEQIQAYNYLNITLQLNLALVQTLIEPFHAFLAPWMATPWVHLIDFTTLVLTTSAQHRIVGRKWSILLEFSYHTHCNIGKCDVKSNVSLEQTVTTIVVPNNSANLASLIEKWMHKMKWSTSLCGIIFDILDFNLFSQSCLEKHHKSYLRNLTPNRDFSHWSLLNCQICCAQRNCNIFRRTCAPRDYHTTLLQLRKIFREGKISIEECVFAQKVDSIGLLIDAVGSVYNDFVFGICRPYCFDEASNWVYTMIKNDIGTIVACYYIFFQLSTDMGNIDLFLVVFPQKLVSKFKHNSYTVSHLIACQFLGARLSAALTLRIMVHEGIGIKVTTPLCVVSILPLLFARTWCTATSLLQPYNQPHFSTIFAAIRKLMCANFSNILVTEDVMSVMFGFWLWLLGDNLIFLTRQSKKWDPGGCSIVHKKGMLNLELTLGVTTLIQQHYLNFNLEDKVGFKGDGNVMILKEKTMSSNEDTKFVITVRTRGRGMHIKE
jgi:hypothetical protein